MKYGELTNPSNQYVVSYNDNDFYCNTINLNTVDLNAIGITQTNIKDVCDSSIPNGNAPSVHVNAIKDFKNNICDNFKYFNKFKEMQTKHTGADGRYADSQNFYEMEKLKTVNLGVGILILIAVIYKNYR